MARKCIFFLRLRSLRLKTTRLPKVFVVRVTRSVLRPTERLNASSRKTLTRMDRVVDYHLT